MLWFSSKERPTWSVAGVFALGYGVLRFVAEFFREPDEHLGFVALGWMTRGQLLSLPMIVLGVYLIATAYGKAGGAAQAALERRQK